MAAGHPLGRHAGGRDVRGVRRAGRMGSGSGGTSGGCLVLPGEPRALFSVGSYIYIAGVFNAHGGVPPGLQKQGITVLS